MNDTLTFNTIAFERAGFPINGSLRSSSARGIFTPDKLIIWEQAYTDPETKIPGKQVQARFDRWATNSVTGKLYRQSIWVVSQISNESVAADDTALNATFKAAIADANFLTDLQNSEK